MSIKLSLETDRAAPPRWIRGRTALVLAALLSLVPFCVAEALDPTRTITQLHHTAWDIKAGVPANIRAIVQTPDGYLWLGSVDGLYRFDGLKIERISAETLASPSVDALAVTRAGGLWIGYERPVGVISLLEHGRVRHFPIDVPSSSAVHGFATGPDGKAWAATPDRILAFDGQRWRLTNSDWGTSFGEAPGGVWSFAVDRDGIVWSKNLLGLYYLLPGASRFVLAPGYPGGAAGFARDGTGRLLTPNAEASLLYWLPTRRDLQMGLPALARLDVRPLRETGAPADAPDSLRGPILVDRDGALWGGNFSSGGLFRSIYQARNQNLIDDQFTNRDGLSSNLVHTLFEDREGNVWIGTGLGLDRFRNANLVTERDIPAGFRARFLQASGNALYAYTGWSSTATRDTDGSQSLYRILPGRPPELFVRNIGRLRGMDVDSRTGQLWFVTQKGLQPLNGRTLGTPLDLPVGVRGDQVFSGAHDRTGQLWISVYGKGIYRRALAGQWTAVPVRPRVPATGVLVPAADGGMWVRYSGGSLFRLMGSAIRDCSRNQLRIGDVTLINPLPEGLLIGGESGIGFIRNGQSYQLRAAELPALSGVTGIVDGGHRSTWIFTQQGLLRADTASLKQALARSDPRLLRYELFDSRDGLPGTPHGANYGKTVAADAGGRIWATTGNGLVWIEPRNLHHNVRAPTVVIRSVTAEGRQYDFPSELRLPAGTSNLQIDYAALSLTAPERNRYRYRLESVDRDWIDPGAREQAFYTNLGPGTYRFQVIGSNNDGVWDRTGATLLVTIPPTFLQSTTFRLLLALAVALALWALYRWRTRQLASRIRGRLEARLAERERIARELHDTLLQGFQGLLLRFQSVADRIPKDLSVRSTIDEVLDRAENVLTEGRDRVKELRRAHGDLLHSLSTIAEEHSGGETLFNLQVEGAPRRLHPLVEDEAARIAAEAIRNAFRHADATRVRVSVSYLRRRLQIDVADDGIGMNPGLLESGVRPGHYGLIGMRERALRIGGKLTIMNSGGCHVMLSVPSRYAYAKSPLKPERLREKADS